MASVSGLRARKSLNKSCHFGSVLCSPHTLLVDLPCDIEECRRACARPRQESKDKSPTAMLGIQHELVLVQVTVKHHALQCTIHVLHEGHA